jgi:hypothetical protein
MECINYYSVSTFALDNPEKPSTGVVGLSELELRNNVLHNRDYLNILCHQLSMSGGQYVNLGSVTE